MWEHKHISAREISPTVLILMTRFLANVIIFERYGRPVVSPYFMNGMIIGMWLSHWLVLPPVMPINLIYCFIFRFHFGSDKTVSPPLESAAPDFQSGSLICIVARGQEEVGLAREAWLEDWILLRLVRLQQSRRRGIEVVISLREPRRKHFQHYFYTETQNHEHNATKLPAPYSLSTSCLIYQPVKRNLLLIFCCLFPPLIKEEGGGISLRIAQLAFTRVLGPLEPDPFLFFFCFLFLSFSPFPPFAHHHRSLTLPQIHRERSNCLSTSPRRLRSGWHYYPLRSWFCPLRDGEEWSGTGGILGANVPHAGLGAARPGQHRSGAR